MVSKAFKIAFKLDAMMSNGFGKTFDAAEERFAIVGDKLSSVGKGLTLGVTLPLVGIGTAAVKVGADFENSLGVIQARTGMTADEVDYLSKNIRGLAVSGDYGAFGAREVANALGQVAVSGDDAYRSTELMRNSMVLATATNTDLASATGFLNLALMKTQSDVSSAERYINAFSAVVSESGMSMIKLEKAIIALAPTMNQTGSSVEEMSGALNVLYRGGLYGIKAARGLEQITNTLISPNNNAAAAMERLGVSVFDAAGYMRPLNDILLETMSALDDTATEQERLNLQNKLFSTVYASAVFDELQNNREAWMDSIDVMYEATSALDGTGRAFEMAAIQQDGMAGSAAQVQATLEEISLQISDILLPHVSRMVGMVGSAVSWFANLDEGTRNLIFTFAGLAAATGPVLMVSGKVVRYAGKLNKAYRTFTGTLKAVREATNLATAAQEANTKLTKINTAVTKTANAEAAARKVAKTAEAKALKLAAQAEVVKATAGANSTKAMLAATKAEQAKTAANAAGKVATKKAIALEKIRANQTVVSTATLQADTAAKNANTLAASKLGKAITLLNKAKAWLAVKTGVLSTSTAAFAATQKTAAASTKSVTLAKSALALGAKGLSVAFKVMSVAIMKIPVFGWILAAITGIGIGIAILIRRINHVSEEYKAFGEEADKLRNRQQQLTDSSANAAEEFGRNTRILQEYGSRLESVADQTEHLANMQASNLTEKARLTREAIELDLELQEVYAKRNELEERLNSGLVSGRGNRRAVEQAINDLIAAEEGYRAALEANAVQMDFVNELYNDNVRALENISRAQHQATVETYGLEMAMRRQAFTAEEWADAQEQALDRMNRSFENYKRLTTNAFRTVNENAAVSVTELTNNLLSNAAMVEEWSKNMALLTEKGLDEGLLEQLRQAGPEAAATVCELVNASDYELAALNEAFADSTRVAVESIQRELDPMGVTNSAEELIDSVAITILENKAMEDALIAKVNAGFEAFSNTIVDVGFDNAGYNMTQSAAQGIGDGTINIENAMRHAARRGMAAMKDELEMNSPSKKALAIGQNYVESVAMGMYAKTGVIEKAHKKISSYVAVGYKLPDGTGQAANAMVGRSNAYSAQTGFNRYNHLSADGNGASFIPKPVDTLKRMGEAAYHQGGDFSINYNPVYHIEGGGFNVDDLKAMLNQRDKEGESKLEQFIVQVMRKDEYRKMRMANA